MISIKNLSAGYGQVPVLENFSLELEAGEIYALIGPSGCGKSTLLKALCGILPLLAGSIEDNGKPLPDNKRMTIGYVPQNYGLLAWKTVQANILLPLEFKKSKTRNQAHMLKDESVSSIIEELGLHPLLNRYPGELSGGQKQRVALARAFISQPALLLMDEPFSALDTFTSEISQALFLNIWKARRVTTLFITHNINEAAALGTRIVLMNPKTHGLAACIDNPAAISGDEAEKIQIAAEIKGIFQKMLAGENFK